MPATFGAVCSVLEHFCEIDQSEIKSILDIGSGTGAVLWAANHFFDFEKVVCMEREPEMRKLGEKYSKNNLNFSENIKWLWGDIVTQAIQNQYDMVTASYALNEMTEKDREEVLFKLWQATKKALVIIEPGTPEGFRQLKKAREKLISLGASIAAPCFHQKECRLKEQDWCHFTARIARSKYHKLIKDGDVPYEDEKFCYMIFVKEKPEFSGEAARILRHPVIEKGRVILEICTESENKSVMIKKKDGEIFKIAKKSKCGDKIFMKNP